MLISYKTLFYSRVHYLTFFYYCAVMEQSTLSHENDVVSEPPSDIDAGTESVVEPVTLPSLPPPHPSTRAEPEEQGETSRGPLWLTDAEKRLQNTKIPNTELDAILYHLKAIEQIVLDSKQSKKDVPVAKRPVQRLEQKARSRSNRR